MSTIPENDEVIEAPCDVSDTPTDEAIQNVTIYAEPFILSGDLG
jgi:hypothetical protein